MPPESDTAVAEQTTQAADPGAPVDRGESHDFREPDLDRFFGADVPDAKADAAAQEPAAATDAVAPEAAADEGAATEQTNTDGGETAQQTVAVDDELRQWAESLGLTEQEIGAFQKPEELQRFVSVLQRRELEEARLYEQYLAEQQQSTSEGQQQTQTAAPAAQPAPAADAASAAQALSFGKFKLEVNEEDFDENTLKVINGINDHYGGVVGQFHGALTAADQRAQAALAQVEELTSYVSDLAKWRAQEVQNRFDETVDNFFINVDPAYKAEFGDGTGRKLKADSKEMKSRTEIVNDAKLWRQLSISKGQGDPGIDGALSRMLKLRFADQHKQQAREEVAQEIGRRKTQAVARPTQRQSPSLPPEAKALKTIRDHLHKAGVATDANGEAELDRFFGGPK